MAPRRSVRIFPDADQLAITTTTIINESRITFSGQRGIVLCWWKVGVEKGTATNIQLLVAAFNSNISPVAGGTGVDHLSGAAGDQVGLWAFAIVQDPPVGSFIEMEIQLSGGQVELRAGRGVSFAMSFEPGVEAGPTVTLG